MYDTSYMIPGFVFIVGIIAIVLCNKKKNKKALKAVYIVFPIALIGSLVYMLSSMGVFNSEEEKVDTSKNKVLYYQAIGDVIGNEITGKCLVEDKALIITRNNYFKDKVNSALIDKLVAAIGSIAQEPVVDYIRKGKKEATKAMHFNDMQRKHWYCDLVVSLEGLPTDVDYMEVWKLPEDKRPKVIVFTDSSKIGHMKHYLKEGKIEAIFCRKPKDTAKLNDEPPADSQQAYRKHFIIITPRNFDEMKEKYKGWLD